MMMDNIVFIEMPRYLTSFEFYNNVITQVEQVGTNTNKEVVLDFSKTFKIEPLVIPNLLSTGWILKRRLNKCAHIYIPDISYSAKVKNYLNEIKFVDVAQRYDLYNFMTIPDGGLQGKRIDPICGTLFFNSSDTIDTINRGVEDCIVPFAEEYLYRFNTMRTCDIGIYYINEIAEFLEEMVVNAKIHARSFSFTTLHAKHANKMVYLAVSDIGCGFCETIGSDLKVKNEIEAILLCVYKRKDSGIYGLYNVIRRVLEFGGKVRIHSNNTQIIFTPKVLNIFLNGELMRNPSFWKYNIKRTGSFMGVHIEVELPLEREV